jgi:hypothetical protein
MPGGMPTISKSDEMITILDDERVPLLYLEVNLGHNMVSKLVVFEGDEPNEVIDLFAKQNNLSEEKRNKLSRVVNE